MKRLLSLALLLALHTPASAQQASPTFTPDLPVVPADQLVLEYLTVPNGVDTEVLGALMRLHRRDILVENGDGSLRGPLSNFQSADDSLLLYDTADYVAKVKDTLAKVTGAVPKPVDVALRTEVYVPRFVEVGRLVRLLDPLQRSVSTRSASGRGWDESRNITFQESPSMIVLNDTPEQVTRMLELLARIDQAPPQVLVTCWLVRGSFEDQGLYGLPPELVENLKKLLPYSHYGLVTTAMVRTSVMAGMERSLSGTYDAGGDFRLQMRPGAADMAGKRLAFERIEFTSSEGHSFDTSAVLGFDDFTVLGAAGSEPLLVVLQVKPAQG
jgi:hypothetical protein